MTGIEDVGASTGRARALRTHVGGHGHGRGQDGLDDLAHGAVQATRRVQHQHHQGRTAVAGLVDAAHDIVGTRRTDGAFDAQHPGRRRGVHRHRKTCPAQQKAQQPARQQAQRHTTACGAEGKTSRRHGTYRGAARSHGTSAKDRETSLGRCPARHKRARTPPCTRRGRRGQQPARQVPRWRVMPHERQTRTSRAAETEKWGCRWL